jgi:hypothetical protein
MEVFFIKSHKLRNAIPDDKLKEKISRIRDILIRRHFHGIRRHSSRIRYHSEC